MLPKRKFLSYLLKLEAFFIGIYGILSLVYWMFLLPPGTGDEGLMATYLMEAQSVGFLSYIQNANLSIPHYLLVFFPSKVIPPYVALRVIGGLFSFFIFFYMIRRIPIKIMEFRLHLLFYLFSGTFLIGTNDSLMVFFFMVFFVECYRFIEGLDTELTFYAPAALISAFFTREISIVFIPIVILALWFIRKKLQFSNKLLLCSLATLLFWLVLNLPALFHIGHLSYDNKVQEKQRGASWEQLKFLSQRYANEGKIEEYQYLDWSDVNEYLEANGKESLPYSLSEAIFFDLEFTIKEFFKDFMHTLYFGLRQISLAVFLPFALLGLFFAKNPINRSQIFFGLSTILAISAFSFIIIAYVEIRWLATAFLLAIIGWNLTLENSSKYYLKLRYLNLLCLLFLTGYGISSYIKLIMPYLK